DNFAYPAGLQQGGKPVIAGARVVADYGQIACALFDEAVYKGRRQARVAESADENGRPVLDVCQGGSDRIKYLVDHDVPFSFFAARRARRVKRKKRVAIAPGVAAL